MKHIYLALNWLFGILFILTGIASLIKSPLAGLSLIVISLLLLPPARKFVYEKTNKKLPVKARGIVIFILFAASGLFMSQSQEKISQELAARQAKEKAEKIAQIRQQNIDYFNANREQIILFVKNSLSSKEYQSVISQSAKYLLSGDAELIEIHSLAKKQLSEIQKTKKTEKLLAELKSVPAKEYEKNKNLYQQLAKLYPENKKYKNKVSFYAKKVEEAKQKQLAAEARKKRIKSQFSAWDGSHYKLERLIKKSMNDPDSYEHDETVYWDKGGYLIVKTTYRGKNAFGGIVRNFVKAKVSLDGQILQVLDQT